jgi:hypothetical protein
MKRWTSKALWFVVTAALLAGGAGCTDAQWAEADKVIADVNDVGATIGGLPDSPAGGMIPGDLAALLKLVGIGTGALYGGWELFRRKQMQGALTTVVRTIDKASAETKAELLPAIKARMVEAGAYARQNSVIDKAKA